MVLRLIELQKHSEYKAEMDTFLYVSNGMCNTALIFEDCKRYSNIIEHKCAWIHYIYN